jgi:hypothetical protein
VAGCLDCHPDHYADIQTRRFSFAAIPASRCSK